MREIRAMYIRSDSLSRDIYISYFYVCSLDSVSFSITQNSVLQNNLDDFAIEAIELLYKNIVILCQNSYFCLICYYVVLERVCDLSLIVCFVGSNWWRYR